MSPGPAVAGQREHPRALRGEHTLITLDRVGARVEGVEILPHPYHQLTWPYPRAGSAHWR